MIVSYAKRPFVERCIESALFLSALITIVTTVSVVWILLSQSLGFFREVSLLEFLTGTEWTPLFTEKHFGILPLVAGTVLTSAVAIAVALPMGLVIAIYLSEYAPRRIRKIVKPLLEILAAVPTVVYGYFALVVVTPFLQTFIPGLPGFNALSPGLVMGLMIMPFITSLSEDALYAVPTSLRDAAYAMGSTRFQTSVKVLVPAASSGIISSALLAVSRGMGETMIVAIAAGQQPNLTFNPLAAVETITTYIVQVSLGDVPHGSLEFRTIFAAGAMLFVLTFLLNNLSYVLHRKFRHVYE